MGHLRFYETFHKGQCGGKSNLNLMRNFSSYSLDIFQEKGGGPDQNPNFLRNFCLLDMRREKKFLEHVQRYRGGGGVKAVQQNPKSSCFLSLVASLSRTDTIFESLRDIS